MAESLTRRRFLKTAGQAAAAAGLAGSGVLLKGCSRPGAEFDLIIKNGEIFDGLGGEPFQADIGLVGDVIRKIGIIDSRKGKTIIDASGRQVSPGFIDLHDHSGIELLVNPKAESAVHQGITTTISGQCGASPFPVSDENFEKEGKLIKEMYGIDLDWRDIQGFLRRLEEEKIAFNYSTFVGHGDIRGLVVGYNDRPAKPDEMDRMRDILAQNLKQGALGLSTGLEYVPGSFAGPEEITTLCGEVARHGGIYASHMRSEGDFLLESLEETYEVGRKTGVRIQISHYKVAYAPNWPKIDAAVRSLERAASEGLDVFCDRYPYTAGSTGLNYNFPLWARQGTSEEFLARLKDSTLESRLREDLKKREKKLGTWENVVITEVFTEANKQFEGMSIAAAEKAAGKDTFTFIRDILIEEDNRVGMVIFMMNEDNLKRILAHPLVGIGCDGSARAPYGLLGKGKPHPRVYGSFPRVLGKYVREEKILPLKDMIRKMTSLPAEKYGFDRRGALLEGHYADLVVFDADSVMDKATWADPHQYPRGIPHVIINGIAVILDGEHTGALPGKVLRRRAMSV
jgi:N-acyl-D-amino-acid deacylase